MPRRDVPDLVPEHRRELRFVGHLLHQPARDEHLAPGEREGVDHLGIEHRELPRQRGIVGLGVLRERLAQRADVAPDRRRGNLTAVLGRELRLRFGAQRDLLTPADHAELALARRGVDRAGRERGEHPRGEREAEGTTELATGNHELLQRANVLRRIRRL